MEFRRGGESKSAPIYFSKIVLREEGVVEKMKSDTGLAIDFEPFLDIFTLDGLPESVVDVKKWWRGRRLIRLCQLYRFPRSSVASNIGWLKLVCARVVGFFVSLFLPRTKSNGEMMLILDRFAAQWPYEKSSMVVEPAFFRMRLKRIFPRDMYGSPREVAFEDGVINVPERVEEFLVRSYGDYMQLPPEEARIPEHALKKTFNHI